MGLDDKIASLKIAPKEFTVPTQDHHGHSARVGFRMPPGMATEVSIVMKHAADFGWSTEADFYRWAVRTGLDTIGKTLQDGRLTNVRAINEAYRLIFAEQKEFVELDSLIDETRKMVNNVTTKGGADTLPVLIKCMRSQLAACNDAFWRERWLGQFDREFGHFFRVASLVNIEDETE